MSFIALVNNAELSLSTSQLVFSARDVGALKDIEATSQRLRDLLAQQETRRQAAEKQGFDEGFSEGKAEGLACARRELAQQLALMAAEAQQQRQTLRASVARLAVQIVRKIADDLGAPDVVSAIARTAVDDLIPDTPLTLWVHPSVVTTVKARFGAVDTSAMAYPRIDVRADESLNSYDCLLKTEFGTTIASLDHQLDSLEKTLNEKLGIAR